MTVTFERWKDVPGYEGLYEVSSLGRIRSLTRIVKRHDGGKQTHHGRVLIQTVGTHGYPAVALRRGRGDVTTRTVHSLVAHAFIGERPDNHEIRHVNGDRKDARAKNLRYGTNKENQHDRREHGTHNFGERNPCAKLTREKVEAIREMSKEGQSGVQIATSFGVSAGTIYDILKGRTWRQ